MPDFLIDFDQDARAAIGDRQAAVCWKCSMKTAPRIADFDDWTAKGRGENASC